MAREFSPRIRRTTFLLVAIAALAVEVAANEQRPVLQSMGLASIWIAVAAVAAWLLPAPTDPRRKPPLWIFPLIAALAAAPFVVEPWRREWTGDGYPLEIQMVSSLRNIGLGLAACSVWLVCLRVAAVSSLFLTLFAVSLTSHPVVMVLLGLYTAAGSIWLMLVYWSGLKSVFVTSDRIVAVEVQEGRLHLPWFGLTLLVLALGSSLALAFVGPKRFTTVLGEWAPTSGGTGETDTYARRGIGDGPEETAGDNAQAAGMVESEKMIEDNKNSLIDAISDMFGPPHKPREDQERMVAAGRVDVIKFHGKLPDNRRPSRDFDTSRKGPRTDRKLGSQGARGLFEVFGKTPLHIRLVAYGTYDAVNNRWIEASKPEHKYVEAEGGDWMRLGQFRERGGWYSVDERHQFKIANLKSNFLPTPSLLTRFRMHRVDRPIYFDWDYDGVLVLAGRKRTPPGVIIHTECRTVDPSRLPDVAFSSPTRWLASEYEKIPETVCVELTKIARAWAGDEPRGWPQIHAVLTRLQTEYTLDRETTAPADHPAPVLWFLNESRRGPDYLFASAAALLLRCLDYPTRVCLGYYVSPVAYDPETAHTPVKNSDLHVWPEVRLEDGHWLTLEPTPGYELLGPSLPLSERIVAMLTALAQWAWQHLAEVICALAVLTGAWWRRREIIDALAVRWWQWFPGPTWREQVRTAVSILERRAGWAGRSRPCRQTVLSWLRGADSRHTDADLDRFTLLAQSAAYSPDVTPPLAEADAMGVCRRILARWTGKRWRDMTVSMGAAS